MPADPAKLSRGQIRVTDGLVSPMFASWNQLDQWLRQVEGFRRVA